MFGNILKTVLNEAMLDVNKIIDAIDGHKRIVIAYNSHGENKATGARLVEFYAYGLTTAGNPAVRGFEPYGDSLKGGIPDWRLFRLDRITYWYDTGQTFNKPPSREEFPNIGDFNPDGDDTLEVVYKIAKFDNIEEDEEDLFLTDAERRLRALKRSRVQGSFNVNDIMANNGFKHYDDNVTRSSGPKMRPGYEKSEDEINNDIELINTKEDNDTEQEENDNENTSDIKVDKTRNTTTGPKLMQKNIDNEKEIEDTSNSSDSEDNGLFLTDTERRLRNLRNSRQQGIRKIDLSNGKPIQEPEPIDDENVEDKNDGKDDLFLTDTERRLRDLRQQKQNGPRKIQLSDRDLNKKRF